MTTSDKLLIRLLEAVVLFIVFLIQGWLVEMLWNWILPGLFGFHTVSYLQSLGLLILCHNLFVNHKFESSVKD